VKTKYANLTDEQRLALEHQIAEYGLLALSDDSPAKTIICEDARCPICDESLEVYTSGNSYVISCCNDGVITSFRGFANPSYLWSEECHMTS